MQLLVTINSHSAARSKGAILTQPFGFLWRLFGEVRCPLMRILFVLPQTEFLDKRRVEFGQDRLPTTRVLTTIIFYAIFPRYPGTRPVYSVESIETERYRAGFLGPIAYESGRTQLYTYSNGGRFMQTLRNK